MDSIDRIEEHGMYFGKNEFYQLIRDSGGVWNDSKERPIVCLMQSFEHKDIYWAIPVGNYEHRDERRKQGYKNILIMIKKIYVLAFIISVRRMKSLYSL